MTALCKIKHSKHYTSELYIHSHVMPLKLLILQEVRQFVIYFCIYTNQNVITRHKAHIVLSVAQQPNSGLGLLIFEVPRSYTMIIHTLGMTRLNERLPRRRGRYLHNKKKRRTFTFSAGFESAIPALERPQTYPLDRMSSGIGDKFTYFWKCKDDNLRFEFFDV